ncbi:phospholipase D active site motif protein [Didymella exigua CBS 183.55]|uniref:Phospholipase n=1 Tax=Didymella exigua CBS 183.55 TaxID=1150837 RepID=A0A6A5RMG0_9PLEO|nr:phospholipase D active site motif protein [Didymella exigua CBS 183.55]KAF1927556.1 phospholipase D active site motif protein [Didymella exigua CBS 183.55]
MSRRDDDLAYGDYHGQGEGQEGDRGFVGDMGRRFFGGKKESSQPQQGSSNSGGMSFLFDKLHKEVHKIGAELKDSFSGKNDAPAQAQQQGEPQPGQEYHNQHRFLSFAPERHGNDIKWYVDGASYMHAVSVALEQARESIWILDWWLSPELYLRRPPAKNQQYRVDRMLLAAAERGVRVNVIVYKEVTQALTLSSAHTKHHLEDLHQNIGVFRHPDHTPDASVLSGQFFNTIKNMSFSPAKIAQLPLDGLKSIYGSTGDTVLYWAHHEKLCLIDGNIAFMGGLDLCYGRWDTNSHPIADAHPGSLDRIVFPGQDFNNARMLDFVSVDHWEENKLDRTQSSRMGWSDVALNLRGPVVQDLRTHFTQRWNFIYDEKYSHKSTRYLRLPDTTSGAQQGGEYPPPQQREFEEGEEGSRGFGGDGEEGERGLFGRGGGFRQKMYNRVHEEYEEHYGGAHEQQQYQSHAEHGAQRANIDAQITRSSTKWSHNISTEHSIQNAYIETIRDSQHFVYIENQFFITATGDKQRPIKNQVGAAIVERIIRAARNGEKYKMIVVIPAVPAFAGDLKLDEALGTRAIMEFQYDSINRGGHSIYEEIAKAGFNPMDYIRFYNLRSYDRINASKVMQEAEQRSGVSYAQASEGFDAAHEGTRDYQAYRPPPTAEYGVYEMDGGGRPPQQQYEMDAAQDGGVPNDGRQSDYNRYQQEAQNIGGRQGLGDGRWDSVCECYMLNGEDIRNVPWEGGAVDEMDAFVSEELYIHTKLLIADDTTVICGSANLNDRSQLGDHDSEIAIIIRDPDMVDSYMDGRPYQVSRFASSLRREIFRKHLGLLKHQPVDGVDDNWQPVTVPQQYDWGSEMDNQVADPLSDDFQNLWNWRANTNTQAFGKIFHPVPSDEVQNWKQYDEYYSRFFGQSEQDKENKKPSLYKWGHVVAENFSQGEQGVHEVKELLSTIRGTLVEMPLLFLKEEDIAKEGVGLNALTEEIYT